MLGDGERNWNWNKWNKWYKWVCNMIIKTGKTYWTHYGSEHWTLTNNGTLNTQNIKVEYILFLNFNSWRWNSRHAVRMKCANWMAFNWKRTVFIHLFVVWGERCIDALKEPFSYILTTHLPLYRSNCETNRGRDKERNIERKERAQKTSFSYILLTTQLPVGLIAASDRGGERERIIQKWESA